MKEALHMTENEVVASEPGGKAEAPAVSRSGGGRKATDAALERELNRVMEEVITPVVNRTVEERQRAAVSQGLAEVMRDALNTLAESAQQRSLTMAIGQPMGMAADEAPGTFGNGVGSGVAALKQVQNLGFVEFTAGLVTGTFDAVIGATIKQMEAYAALVADLAKTLAQFQAENVSDAQINAHLANRYPDGSGGTAVREDFELGNAKLQEMVEALIQETSTLTDAAVRLTRNGADGTANLNLSAADTAALKFTGPQVALIRTSIGRKLATTMMEHLRAMAREGMARIEITDGRIESGLTFNVSATDQQSTQKSKFHSDSFEAGVKGQAGWGWGSVAVNVGYNQLNVNTVNESSSSTVQLNAQMIGRVSLNFKTASFPAIATGG
jgi:hypothetical protein